MATKHQKFTIEVSEKYNDVERAAIAQDVIDFIYTRTTEQNKDKNNKRFPAYSKEYTQSVDFKAAGKSKSDIDLQLSGDMLASMKVLKSSDGKITIGYENGSTENAKADGNVRGTYGTNRASSSKARDFMGLTPSALKNILSDYPLRSKGDKSAEELRAERVAEFLQSTEQADLISLGINLELLNDDNT